MASKNKDVSKDNEKGYQPKATARHAKIIQSKKDEVETFRKKIGTDKFLAKKYESNRRTEIKALPKDERRVAKAELKESIANRKEAERKDKAKLQTLIHEERAAKVRESREPFDEDAWVDGGKKKGKKEQKAVESRSEPEPGYEDDDYVGEGECAEEESEPEENPKKKD